MARWKLMTSHYLLTTKPAKWRYQEVANGESVEHEYIIPRMLDIHDPKCWTNRAIVASPVSRGGSSLDPGGEIIVCCPGKGEPTDIEFLGDPTPDMLPQDEEAEIISAGFQDHWAYKPDAVNDTYSQSLIDRSNFTEQPTTVQIEGLGTLVQALDSQARMIGELLAAQSAVTTPQSPRRP